MVMEADLEKTEERAECAERLVVLNNVKEWKD